MNARSEDNDNTPLMAAAAGNPNPAVIEALITAGADISRRNSFGETPLMHAAAYNLNQKAIKAVITALVDAGDDVNAKDNNGKTPLFWAASSANLEAVVTLLDLGADANERNTFGEKALEAAEIKKEFKGTDAIKKLREASKIQ